MRRVRQRRLGRIAPTFRDVESERLLEHRGFVVLRLLDAAAAADLGALLSAQPPAPGDEQTGLFNDSWATDRQYVRKRSDDIGDIFGPCVKRIFMGHRPLIWGTSVKWPGESGVVGAHRDPTFVDERRFRSVGIWCAVDEVDRSRGTLEVLPGSHRPDGEVRVHQSEHNLLPTLRPEVEQRFEAIPLGAGEAIVYDHSLVHRSGPNRGPNARVAVMTHLVPDEAEARYAVPVGAGRAAVLAVDQEFFLTEQVNQLDVEAVLRSHPTLSTVKDPPGFGTLA